MWVQMTACCMPLKLMPIVTVKIKGMKFLPMSRALCLKTLKRLQIPGYLHKYYVDLTPTVVKGKGLLGGEDLKTVLVGGLGKGGKGYFALDISAPASMNGR